MSWSYDATQLAISVKDQVRLLIGDTNELEPLIEDEELMFYVDQHPGDIARAALACINVIIARITSTPDYTLGPYSESNANRVKAFRSLKAQLEKQTIGYQPPLMQQPTTTPIFKYGITSETCCIGGDGHE